jgi:hypothetical protein
VVASVEVALVATQQQEPQTQVAVVVEALALVHQLAAQAVPALS